MRKVELEAWVVSICDRVVDGHPIEDDRVELKRTYLDDRQDEARRIAALCNSANGDHALWLVGVDEKGRSVPGAPAEPDPANWLPQLHSYWPDLVPGIIWHLSVPYGGVSTVAYLFDASRAPYTVKVSGQGKVDREVPIREGARTRSARREDLLRMVVPAVRKPTVEVLRALLDLNPGSKTDASEGLWLSATLWIENVTDTIFVPHHTCQGSVLFSKSGGVDFDFALGPVSRGPMTFIRSGELPPSPPIRPGATIHAGDGQLVVRGPGTCEVMKGFQLSELLAQGDEAELVLTFVPVGGDQVTARRTLYSEPPATNSHALRTWGTGPGC